MSGGRVIAVACDPQHRFAKRLAPSILLVPGLGVAGDAHSGATVQHLSRLGKTPSEPNLRQVHLIHVELFDELALAGFAVGPGELGENVTTRGIDLLGLPRGARLRLGASATIQLAGPAQSLPPNRRQHRARRDGGNVGASRGRLADPQGGRDGGRDQGRGGSTGDAIAVMVPPGPGEPLAPGLGARVAECCPSVYLPPTTSREVGLVIIQMVAAVVLASVGAAVGDPGPPEAEPAPAHSDLERALWNYRQVVSGSRQLSELSPQELYDLMVLDARTRAPQPDLRTARQRCIDHELDRLSGNPTRLALRTIDLKCRHG